MYVCAETQSAEPSSTFCWRGLARIKVTDRVAAEAKLGGDAGECWQPIRKRDHTHTQTQSGFTLAGFNPTIAGLGVQNLLWPLTPSSRSDSYVYTRVGWVYVGSVFGNLQHDCQYLKMVSTWFKAVFIFYVSVSCFHFQASVFKDSFFLPCSMQKKSVENLFCCG